MERVTYTFIAFPGVLLGFATVHNIVREVLGKCWKQHALDFCQCLWSALVLTLEVGLFLGMYVAATRSRKFSTIVSPSWLEAYDCTIQALAYGSATLIVGVKCFGIFCHGPESCRHRTQKPSSRQVFSLVCSLQCTSAPELRLRLDFSLHQCYHCPGDQWGSELLAKASSQAIRGVYSWEVLLGPVSSSCFLTHICF